MIVDGLLKVKLVMTIMVGNFHNVSHLEFIYTISFPTKHNLSSCFTNEVT